jgi:hypothetical protein
VSSSRFSDISFVFGKYALASGSKSFDGFECDRELNQTLRYYVHVCVSHCCVAFDVLTCGYNIHYPSKNSAVSGNPHHSQPDYNVSRSKTVINIHIPAKQRVPDRSASCSPTEPTTHCRRSRRIWTNGIINWRANIGSTICAASIACLAVGRSLTFA